MANGRWWRGRANNLIGRFVTACAQFILHGPHRGDYDEPPGVCETVFSWPVRIAIVVASWLLAIGWVDTSTAGQIGWTLEYAGAVAISLAVSVWSFVFVVDGLLAAVWLALTFMPPPDPDRSPYLYWIQHGVELANRQLSHIEAFWIWMGVVLPCAPRIDVQFPALLGLAAIGPALIDRITQWLRPGASRGSGGLQSARRPVIYGATVLGLLILLIYRSAGQRMELLPLIAVLSTGLCIRMYRHVRRQRHATAWADRVQEFRRRQRQLTRGVDVVLGPMFMLASVVAILALSLYARQRHDRLNHEALDGPPPDPQSCVAESGGPVGGDISMLLLADSQIHELGGARFPGQTELADSLVPSAVRPVELDMLSAAPLAHFRRAFDELVHDTRSRSVFWAHLGDLADLSCSQEIRRARELLSQFGSDKLAGIAPGNHDMSFTGNFLWSPYWADACKSGRADKATSNRLIEELLAPAAGGSARLSRPGRSRWPSWLVGTGGLVTVTPLGSIVHRGAQRSVVAIFVDTGDDATSDWGIAGVFGTYSADQSDRLRALVLDLKRAGVSDPLWLVFSHHPLGEMTGASRARLTATLAWLDADPLGARSDPGVSATREPEPRIIALVAAHTHRAESHRVCIARRVVRELVIGSTIDAPQQGATLEIGADPRGLASLRLRTVPTVARSGFTCGARPTMIDAEDCQRIVARLRREPSCEPLFDEPPSQIRDCSELERPPELGETLAALFRSTNPVEPEAIRSAQSARARRLLSCVCRAPGPSDDKAGQCKPLGPKDDPLDDEVFGRRIDDRLAGGGDQADRELACLSWAASVQQAHKAMGMTFASALRCAFDDRTIPAAQESVATLEVQPCQ
jgi:3',5'-cyclic AMP phosphodiesterase CpdA